MIQVTETIKIDEDELEFSFIRSPGPGGQNVNKVATSAQLRFDVTRSPSLSDDVKERLKTLAGSRSTLDGVIVITARKHRSQERNREEAILRLTDLIRRAAERQKPRKITKPTMASRRRRLDEKNQRAQVKRLRGSKGAME